MITVMVFTLNEEVNLPHCLQSLAWCDDIVVIDSGSTDGTEEISSSFKARFFVNEFKGFGTQRNWAIDNCAPKYEWILMLDADERVPDSLVAEMRMLINQRPQIGAARMRRRFHMWGRWLRWSSLYPVWVVRLVHRERVRYLNRGHAETQLVEGEVAELLSDLIDENHKGMDAWEERQSRYAKADAVYEINNASYPLELKNLLSADPLSRKTTLKRIAWRLPFRPAIFFVYSYVFRLGFLDGKMGVRFCLMKSDYQRQIVKHKKYLSGVAAGTNGDRRA